MNFHYTLKLRANLKICHNDRFVEIGCPLTRQNYS